MCCPAAFGLGSVDRIAEIVGQIARVWRGIFRAGADAALAGMVGHDHRRFSDVVAVLGLGKLVAEAGWILVRARLVPGGLERRIDGDANHVLAWREGSWPSPPSSTKYCPASCQTYTSD